MRLTFEISEGTKVELDEKDGKITAWLWFDAPTEITTDLLDLLIEFVRSGTHLLDSEEAAEAAE